MIFTVRHMANLPLASLPGYHDWLEAYDADGKWVGTYSFVPDTRVAKEPVYPRLVQERQVEATGPTHALHRFYNWLADGSPAESLLAADHQEGGE